MLTILSSCYCIKLIKKLDEGQRLQLLGQKSWISPELYILIDRQKFELRGPGLLVVNINIIGK